MNTFIEELDKEIEEFGLLRSEIYKEPPYEEDSVEMEYLMEKSGDVIVAPFNKEDIMILKAFGVDPEGVKVFEHVVLDQSDYEECIIYSRDQYQIPLLQAEWEI